jgi:hypothetical protein
LQEPRPVRRDGRRLRKRGRGLSAASDALHAHCTLPELAPPQNATAAARWQVPRVARSRNVAPERVVSILEEQMEGRELGLFGEPTVNVLLLNLALDRRLGRATLPAVPAASADRR